MHSANLDFKEPVHQPRVVHSPTKEISYFNIDLYQMQKWNVTLGWWNCRASLDEAYFKIQKSNIWRSIQVIRPKHWGSFPYNFTKFGSHHAVTNLTQRQAIPRTWYLESRDQSGWPSLCLAGQDGTKGGPTMVWILECIENLVSYPIV